VAERTSAPYGTWAGPFTPGVLGLVKRLEDVQWTPDGGALLWVEGRSGQGVLVIREGKETARDLTELHNVRGGVGYGGGEFVPGRGFAVFAEKDGRLYRVEYAGGAPHPITPGFGASAAPALSPCGKWVLYVHTYEGEDCLALVDSEGRQWPRRLVAGADFYMQPVWSPRGDRIAWVDWNHPNMPWDGTVLRWAAVAPEGEPALGEVTVLAGAPDVPVFQPAFSPDGSRLAFIEEKDEWDSLVVIDLEGGKKHVLLSGAVLREPAWGQGMRAFGWAPDGRRIHFLKKEKGFTSLGSVDAETGRSAVVAADPYTDFSQLAVSPAGGALAYLASSCAVPRRVVVQQEKKTTVRARSCAERIPAGDHPSPEPVSWRADDGTEVHGLFFPAHNPRFSSDGTPPMIVLIHGGPTGCFGAAYSFDTGFFTSRGYACLAVNYRGSSGYGRSYRNALRGRWGELDTADAVGGAKAICGLGRADPQRLVIKGGSAGGFTVLNALARHPGFFRAGVCLYGVANLFTLAADTHKFEQRYLDSMVGRLPEDREKYRDRSPVFQADRIRDPLAVFQGEEDVVVPPSQAEEIVAALRRSGVPHLYRTFPGEGHGWRKSETIVAYYTEVERFLRQYVLFA
jgi:dipeptidyl aminopeptidase/acylaminoacyl peptidase